MMNRLMLGAGLALLAQTPVSAAEGPPQPPGMDRMHMVPETKADAEKRVAERFAAIDANKDGAITREEIDRARDKRRDEFRAQMDKRRKESRDRAFAMMDKDKNGAISRAEFDAAPPPPPPPGARMGMDGPPPPLEGRGMRRMIMFRHLGGPGGMPAPGGMGGPGMMMSGRWFDRVDANHDGKVTMAEARTAADALFDRFDRDHDGKISAEERRVVFRGHMRRGPGGWGRVAG